MPASSRSSRLCHTLGPSVVRPLAIALAAEESSRAIRHLRELLLGFGAAGRQSVEQLKNSPNPKVRRMAIDLLRVFGGREALPELASMLDDADPQVQRESLRAIVQIGTEEAFGVLEKALVGGGTSHDTILQQLIGLRDEKSHPAPLLRAVPHVPARQDGVGARADHRSALGTWPDTRNRRERSATSCIAASGGHRSARPRSARPRPRRCATSARRRRWPCCRRRSRRAAAACARGETLPAIFGSRARMNAVQRARFADDLVRKLASAIRSAQLYAAGHPIVVRSVSTLIESLTIVHASSPALTIGIVGEDLVVGDIPVPRAAENMGELMKRLQQAGVERIAIARGVETAEIMQLIQALATADSDRVSALAGLKHIRVGRLEVEERVDAPGGDMATFKRLYEDAVSVAGQVVGQRRSTRASPTPNAAARDRGFAGAGGRAEPDRAARAHRAEELRQLHVHAHGERVDPDHGPGARPRDRGRAARASSACRR